jgi:hypothetical protein
MCGRVHYSRARAKFQLVKKFPAFYRTRVLITASTQNRQAYLNCPFLYELHLSNLVGVMYMLRRFGCARAHEVSGRPFTGEACVRSQASEFVGIMIQNWGTRRRSWLRHCATSRKVVGSIPDGVNDITLSVALWPWGRLSL